MKKNIEVMKFKALKWPAFVIFLTIAPLIMLILYRIIFDGFHIIFVFMLLSCLIPSLYILTSKVIIINSICFYRFGIKIWSINIQNVEIKRGNGGSWRTHPALLIFDKDEKEIGWILASLFGNEALEKIETHVFAAKIANRPSEK